MTQWMSALILAAVSFAQTAPDKLEFEAASIKPAVPQTGTRKSTGLMRGGPGTADPGQVSFINATLASVTQTAYDLKNYQFTPPDWMNDAHYDIIAKPPPGAGRNDVRLMLQSLLKERFQLKAHFEKKEVQAYWLVIAKKGAKLKQSDESSGEPEATILGGPNGQEIRLQVSRMPMARLCNYLSNQLMLPVIDQTALNGLYDIDLRFAPEDRIDSTAPTLFTALQEQLGLRLDAKKLAVDVLVIDHAEKTPSGN